MKVRVAGGRVASCALTFTLLAGCATPVEQGQRQQAAACGGFGAANKQTAGTVVGAVGAGLLTGLLTHNVAAGLAGAAAGGLIGNRIGASLDGEDCRALAVQSAMALRLGQDGVATAWNSARTGAAATIVPSNTRTVSRPISIARNTNVTPSPNLEVIGANYLVRRDEPLRLAASASAPVSAEEPLQNGSFVRVVGRVPKQPWLLVARQGVAVGYVEQSALASPAQQAHRIGRHHAQAGGPTPQQTASASSASPYDLDAQAPIRPADLDAPAPPVAATPGAAIATQTVTATVQCRDLTTTMTLKGQSESKAATACRSPDGAWELDDTGNHA